MTYYLGRLPSGRLVSRSSTRPDFTHAAMYPGYSADTLPSFGTSAAGALRNAEKNTGKAHVAQIEVCEVRVVTAAEYRQAHKAG